MNLSTVDGVVGGDMEVFAVVGNGVSLRDVGVVVGLRWSYYIYFAKQLGFLDGLVGPSACVEVRSLLVKQVIWYHAELKACATTEEKHLVTVRNAEEFLKQRSRFVHNCNKLFATVWNLKNRKTCASKIFYCGSCVFECVLTQNGWSCIKIVFLHIDKMFSGLLWCKYINLLWINCKFCKEKFHYCTNNNPLCNNFGCKFLNFIQKIVDNATICNLATFNLKAHCEKIAPKK